MQRTVGETAEQGATLWRDATVVLVGGEVGAHPQPQEEGAGNATEVHEMAHEVGAHLVGEETAQFRGSPRGDQRLGHAEVGGAEQDDAPEHQRQRGDAERAQPGHVPPVRGDGRCVAGP